MGDVISFPRIQSASDNLQAALRELDEAMDELRAACAERDRQLAKMDPDAKDKWLGRAWRMINSSDPYPPA